MEEATVVCRTCLKSAKEKNFVFIDDDSDASVENCGNVREMLQFSVPELDLYVSAKPAICNPCIKQLATVYHFKVKCLNTENSIKGYITRNNLVDYSFVNLSCVVSDEVKVKTQTEGEAIQNQIEDKIKKYMEQDTKEDEAMDTSENKNNEKATKEDGNLQAKTKQIDQDTKETDDDDEEMSNTDSEDAIPLSEVLEKLCKSDQDTMNIDKPDKVSEVITVNNQAEVTNKLNVLASKESTVKKTEVASPVSPQKYKLIPVNINNSDLVVQKPVLNNQPKPQVSTTSLNPILLNQNAVSQAVLLPQGLMGGSKPMFIRIDVSKFLAANQNAGNSANLAAASAEKPVVKKEVLEEEIEEISPKQMNQPNSKNDTVTVLDSDIDDGDESDDAFEESLPTKPIKIKEESSVTITADDILDARSPESEEPNKNNDKNKKNISVLKPKITMIKSDYLIKKQNEQKTAEKPRETPQLVLRSPSELYSIIPSLAPAKPTNSLTSPTQTKYIIHQTSAGTGTQPKFIIQPTSSTNVSTSQPPIVLNNSIHTVIQQPKFIIQQNKDGTFKAIQQQVVPLSVSGAQSGIEPKLTVVKSGTTFTSIPSLIKIVPAPEQQPNKPTTTTTTNSTKTLSSTQEKDSNTVNLENLFKVVTTPSRKDSIPSNQAIAAKKSKYSNNSDDFICPHCPFSTSKVDLLGKHITTVHPQPPHKVMKGVQVVENYACFLCPFSASTMELLRGHHMNFHADQLGDEQMRNFLTRKKKDHKVPASLSKEQTERELQILEKVMKRPEYACNVCVYTTKDKSNFRKHLFTHGTKPMSCPHCEYNCVSPYQMRRHFKQRHNEKDFPIQKGKPYPPLPTGCVKKEVDDDCDYKITLETLKGSSMELDLEGTVL